MKFNCEKDQVQIVESGTDVIGVMRKITQSGLQEDAFYVFDVQNLIEKYNNWKEKLPRVIPYYAVKCNDNALVLRILSSLGVGFDCASKEEIRKVLALGVDSSRIIYANPAKPSSHIRYARDQCVELTTVDSEAELCKIKKLYPSAKIIIRIKCDAAVSVCPLGIKFGCDSDTEAPALMRLARTLEMEVVGVSFHVGSACGEPAAYRRAIMKAHSVFELGNSMGFHMQVLDIGGGFSGNKNSPFELVTEVINDALEEFFPINGNVNVIAEPGRYFVTSAFTLAAFVYAKRVVRNPDSGSLKNMYYINDGIYGSFNILLHDIPEVYPLPLSPQNNHSQETIPCSIWGPTCDSLDQIVENVNLPNLSIGDWIIFENMGAYTFSAACSFNGFPIPKVYTILQESTILLLKDVLQPLEEDFDFEDLPQAMIGDFPSNDEWKENEQLPSIFSNLLNLKKKLTFVST